MDTLGENKNLNFIKKNGSNSNEKNPRWMGDKVSYAALHNWVRNNFERQDTCSNCGVDPGLNKSGYTKLQWANISGEYRRDRKDWRVLCAKCHVVYDIKRRMEFSVFCLCCGKNVKTKSKKRKYCNIKCRKKIWRKKKKNL